MALYHAGCDVYQGNPGAGEVIGDLVNGKVRNLHRHVVLGTFSGPAFEARIETERGRGVVRFLITHEGLKWMEQHAAPQMLN